MRSHPKIDLPRAVSWSVITNRDISSAALLSQAVEEIVESARENDVPDTRIAEELREQASGLSDPNRVE